MIRYRRLTIPLLEKWIVILHDIPSPPAYRLRKWQEDRTQLPPIHPEVVQYVEETFADARMRLRAGFEDSLSPFKTAMPDPAEGYPARLNILTLQGYLGEILGVLAVEHFGAHGHNDWKFPAVLFRFHNQEFQHLDLINERIRRGERVLIDSTEERRPGRTGDDAIGFRIDSSNRITDVLILEAKCLTTNNAKVMGDAHEKISDNARLTSGVHELITLLNDYSTAEAQLWRRALIDMWANNGATAARHDGVVYVCGNAPVRRQTWLPTTPHPHYTGNRKLEGLEIHIHDLSGLVTILFRS